MVLLPGCGCCGGCPFVIPDTVEIKVTQPTTATYDASLNLVLGSNNYEGSWFPNETKYPFQIHAELAATSGIYSLSETTPSPGGYLKAWQYENQWLYARMDYRRSTSTTSPDYTDILYFTAYQKVKTTTTWEGAAQFREYPTGVYSRVFCYFSSSAPTYRTYEIGRAGFGYQSAWESVSFGTVLSQLSNNTLDSTYGAAFSDTLALSEGCNYPLSRACVVATQRLNPKRYRDPNPGFLNYTWNYIETLSNNFPVTVDKFIASNPNNPTIGNNYTSFGQPVSFSVDYVALVKDGVKNMDFGASGFAQCPPTVY